MDSFSQERVMEIFGEVWGKWPSSLRLKDNKGLAHQVFSQFISNQEWLEIFETSLGDETPLVPLSLFIKNLAKKYDKPLGMVKRTVSVELVSPSVSVEPISPRAQEVFQEIRAAWPVNQDHQEALSVAKKAFDSTCQTRDVEDLRTACLAYCEAWFNGEITYPRPYWLKNFLGRDEIIDDWIGKAKYKPSPEEMKVFDAMWAWYPNFINKEKPKTKLDSFEYWRRMVKPEDYFDFMVAVRAYREERKDKAEEAEEEDQAQFTKGFVRFTKEWRDQKHYIAIVTAHLLCREILEVCKNHNLDPQELWKNEMNQHIQGIQKTGNGLGIEDTIGLCLKKICLLDGLTVDIEKIRKEIYSKSWERALLLPKGGVRLDSM
jgi:hypothetical protein